MPITLRPGMTATRAESAAIHPHADHSTASPRHSLRKPAAVSRWVAQPLSRQPIAMIVNIAEACRSHSPTSSITAASRRLPTPEPKLKTPDQYTCNLTKGKFTNVCIEESCRLKPVSVFNYALVKKYVKNFRCKYYSP